MFKKLSFKKIISFIIITAVFLSAGLVLFACNNEDFISKFSKNVNEYDFNININCEEKTLDITQKTKYINLTETVALNKICFHIFPKAFCEGVVNKPVSSLNEKKAYPNGISYGEVNIKSVKLNGENLTESYENADKDILVVKLNEQLFPNESVNLEFEYSLKLPNINHRYGYGDNTINLGNFYLIACVYEENKGFYTNSYHYNGDPFYSDISNFNATVVYDENYILSSTGYKISETILNNKKTTQVKANSVRDFALILSDKFNELSVVVDDIKINYFYYNDKTPKTSLKACEDSIKTFNNLFSKYPYAEINIAESNFVYGGMEYPNLVFISDNIENYEDYIYTIVHEIAHQWWYGVVGNNEYEFGFLDEGLTEYSTYLFYDENPSYNMNTTEMIKNTTNSYLLFLDVYREVFNNVDTSMIRRLDEYNTEPEYIYMAYVKGVLMFDNLKQIIGKDKFIKSLQYYYEENKGKNVVPADLVSAFNKTCKENLTSYFESWFNGSVIIETI